MSWFDKKSWALRRKIRDLQSELATAERDGKYVVEQGLFFAELQEMGDATIMVLGAADRLDAEEETIIRNFLDRNGFSVEKLTLDKSQKTLAGVEIIPPQELTRRVARTLKDQGYRLVDDSDLEKQSRIDEKVVTLSGLLRGISALFAGHVHQLIISTPIKMNMEGNRLLHWMPLVRDSLTAKATPAVLDLCREPFAQAYKYYYGKLGNIEDPEVLSSAAEEPIPGPTDILGGRIMDQPEIPSDEGQPVASSASAGSNGSQAGPSLRDGDEATGSRSATASSVSEQGTPSILSGNRINLQSSVPAADVSSRSTDAAFALARLYKGLIGASEQRRMRNAEAVLDGIAQFFAAKSACLLTRIGPGAPFTVQSNSSGTRCMPIGPEGNVCSDTTLLDKAIEAGAITVLDSTDGSVSHPQSVIAPLMLESGAGAVLYLTEPADFVNMDGRSDSDNLALLARVFREFPDLLIADFMVKN